MAIFRAVETRMPLVRCANTGISMVVDPWGRVSQETETFVEAMIEVHVVPSIAETFYVRHGEWLARGLSAFLGALLLLAILRSLGGGR
jgi:apolipoprotein N-acyltransferase